MPLLFTPPSTPDTTLLVTIEGRWSWDDFHRLSDEVLAWVAGQGCPRWDLVVHVQSHFMPPGAGVAHVQRFFQQALAHEVGLVVMVTYSGLVRTLATLHMTLHPETRPHYRLANTLDGAYSLIQADREVSASPILDPLR